MAMLSPSELAALLGHVLSVEDRELQIPASSLVTDSATWQFFVEEFARALTAKLRTLVRAAVRVQPGECRQLLAAEALRVRDNHGVVSVWQASPSLESVAVELSASLVATFVDRLLGGHSPPPLDESVECRPLTDVDQRLADRLIEAARQSLFEVPHEPRLVLGGSNQTASNLLDAWMPDLPLLHASFEIRFVQGGGTLDWWLPWDLAQTFARPTNTDRAGQTSEPTHAELALQTPIPRSTLVARLAETSLSASDWHSLAVGDVLLTGATPGQPLDIVIDGRLSFTAQAGSQNGQKAARLLRKVVADS